MGLQKSCRHSAESLWIPAPHSFPHGICSSLGGLCPSPHSHTGIYQSPNHRRHLISHQCPFPPQGPSRGHTALGRLVSFVPIPSGLRQSVGLPWLFMTLLVLSSSGAFGPMPLMLGLPGVSWDETGHRGEVPLSPDRVPEFTRLAAEDADLDCLVRVCFQVSPPACSLSRGSRALGPARAPGEGGLGTTLGRGSPHITGNFSVRKVRVSSPRLRQSPR